MKKITFLTLIANILLIGTVSSQIIAGSASAGLIISNPNVSLSNPSMSSTVADVVDLNCDNIPDMKVELYKGATAIDGANYAWLYILNPAYEICSDTGAFSFLTPKYYNLADTLNCSGSYSWNNDTLYHLGNYGCMLCPGPYSISSQYIAYKNTSTSQTGWIKISFNLIDGGGFTTPVTLSIPEVLSPCTNTEVEYSNSGTDTCGVFTYSYNITSPSCAGSCDGSIIITGLTGGTPAYNYNWSGSPTGDSTASIIGLCSGFYSLDISDAIGNSCSAFYAFSVPAPSPITYSISVTNVSCYGAADGIICFTGVSGGTAPYIYEWGTGAITSTSCSYGVLPGSYTICITDGNGCQVCTTVVVLEPLPIQAVETIENATCFGCCDGDVQLALSGGTGAYYVSFTPSATPGTFCPGTYNYCVTDANGCNYCDSVIVSFPSAINDNELNNLLSIYPNPNDGAFVINFSSTISMSEITIEILNLLGEKVSSSVKNKNSLIADIKLSDLSNGLYFVHVNYDGRSIIKKIAISR